MNPQFMNAPEREAYRRGYERGKQEGLQKAAMLIQLVATDSSVFKERILQNSKEAVELRKIFTERGE
jgi:flagellar biosynthesis/type III secretory pathway protein FliH